MSNYQPTIKELLSYAISPLSDAEEHHERHNSEAVIKCIKSAKERLMKLAEAIHLHEELLYQWLDVQRQGIEWQKSRGAEGLTYGDTGFDLEAVHYGQIELLDGLEEELNEKFGRTK